MNKKLYIIQFAYDNGISVENSDDVDLIYTQGGSYWTKVEIKTI